MLHTLLYFLALVSLSTSPNWAKLNQMPVEILGFWRLTFASLILFLWISLKNRKWPSLSDKKIFWLAISGFFFFLHLATYKFAAKNTTISNTMIIFASNPVWSALGAVIFFKEKLNLRLTLSFLIAFLGIFILVRNQIQFESIGFKGDISAILSAVFYALYMLSSKKARLHYDNTIYAFFQYFVCAVCFGLLGLANQKTFVGYDQISWLAVCGLVLLPTFLGHMILTYLVNFMDLTVMTCGKLIEPVLASIMAYFLFHENLTSESWITFLLTGLSMLILFGPGLRKRFQKV